MRVAYLNPVAALGGAERSLLDLIAALLAEREGFEPWLVCGEDGPLVEAARALGVQVEILPLPAALAKLGDSGLGAGLSAAGALASLRFARHAPGAALSAWGYGRALRAVLARIRPDWIHSNALKTHLLTPLYADLAPVAWHLRDAIGQRRLAGRLLRRVAPRARIGIGISRYVVDDARRVLRGFPLVAVENAIDLSCFRPAGPRLDLDALAGLAPFDGLRIGLVATFGRWKGQDTFLEALARLSVGGWRAYVVGGPIYKTAGSQWSQAELEGRARALGLLKGPARLGFVPFQAEPAPVYRALDVVVHASTRPEPFGRTIAEAMACERALVVSDAGGAAELFTPGVEALASPPGDVPALAAALRRLVAEPALRERLGAAAGAQARRRFDRARLAREVGAIYSAYAVSR